jgi:hypothetical protein
LGTAGEEGGMETIVYVNIAAMGESAELVLVSQVRP